MTGAFRDAADGEHRADQHGGVTTLLLTNGTRAATTHGPLSAVFARLVLQQHRESA